MNRMNNIVAPVAPDIEYICVMSPNVQQKMTELKKMASKSAKPASSAVPMMSGGDSLSKVIRNNREAEVFMAELDSAAKRAK